MARKVSGGAKRAIRNSDGTVTLKTAGKVAFQGKGSGAQRMSWASMPFGGAGPKVTKQPGRGPVAKDARN